MSGGDSTQGSSRLVPWRSPTLQVILASSLVGVMGVSLLSPVLPALRSTFGVSDAQVGLIITVYTLPGVFLTPFVGLVADRIGRKRTLIPLLVIFGVAGAGIAATMSFRQVLVLRFFQGVGASALITLAITLIGDYYEGGRQQALIGINSSALGIGAALYPLIGGLLAAVRWNVPFLFFGVALLVALAATVVLNEPAIDEAPDLRTYVGNLWTVLSMPTAIGIYLASFLTFFLFYGGVLTAVPLLLTDEFGVVEPYLGLILSVVSVTNAAVASQYGRLANKIGSETLVTTGFLCFGGAFLGVYAVRSAVHVGLLLVAFGAGFGVVMPALNDAVVSLVSGQLRASMLGLQTSTLRVGQTLGPVAFTGLAEAAFPTAVGGYRLVLPLFGLVAVAAGIAVPLLVRASE
ncbi:MAG: MFS transporter [Haloarculaceae archaeon]